MAKRKWNRADLLNLSGSYWQGCTLQAAVRLEVFDVIGEGRLTAREIADGLHGAGRGVTALLNALSAMDLLIHEGEYYANTEVVRSLLVRASPDYIGYILMHHYHLLAAWSRLDVSIRTGRPVRDDPVRDEGGREAFILGMYNLAMSIAPRLAGELDLKDRRCLLDLGGGPGTYAIQFCLANPGLKAMVYDLPTTRPFAEKIIKKFGLSARVGFMPGDYMNEDIKGDYDAVWLSHTLHSLGPGDALKLVKKAASALVPGGILLIHDFILEDTLDRPLFPAIFSLNMLVNTEAGRSYSEGQLREVMRDAGLRDIRRLPFSGPNASGILAGYC